MATPENPDAARADVVLELLREMRGQREALDRAQALAAAERKSERRWRRLFQVVVFGVPLVLGVIYLGFFLNFAGFRIGPFGDVVGVVRIEGEIGARGRASADRVIPVLEKAFEDSDVKAVVLSIDSPGGAPVEAERIYTAIGILRQKHPKPVVAVIHNLGASAAYLIALHADQIVAGRYSLVGSVGAAMEPWSLDRAIAKLNVEQRVYASGKLKSFLNPFIPITPEVDVKAQRLVDQVGGYFRAEVIARRGSRLQAGVDVATGEVWSGEEAKSLGLVDALGTIDGYVAERWGLRAYDLGPSESSVQLIGRTLQGALISSLRSPQSALRRWQGELQ